MKYNIEQIINFYLLATSLKTKIRRGWIKWHVSSERLESVAEHIYGTCILAISIDSEINLNIDLNKVLKMLILHELEEIIIGDIIPTDQIDETDKYRSGMQAIKIILDGMIKEKEYYELIDEFNKCETEEAKFAFLCDKLEADIQSKVYSDNDWCDIFSSLNFSMINSLAVKSLDIAKPKTLFDLYSSHDSIYFENNDIFIEIINYLKNTNLGDRNE